MLRAVKLPLALQRAGVSTVVSGEVEKFARDADSWWDARGRRKALHSLNAVRVPFVVDGLRATRPRDADADLAGARLLDVGCGAGILAESLARATRASVTGLDPGEALVAAARRHAALDADALANLQYVCSTVEAAAAAEPEAYDAVVASEVVEHVSDYARFLAACCAAVKVGGSLFVTTINRTVASRLWAVWAAEYVTGAISRGTHQWSMFVTPRELEAVLEEQGCVVRRVSGAHYRLLSRTFRNSRSTEVFYCLHAVKYRSILN